MPSEPRRAGHLALLAGVLTLATGCALPRTELASSAVDTHYGVEAELDFWDLVAEQRVVTNDDAIYGLLLAAGESAVPAEAAERAQLAWERGWLADPHVPPHESATVGMIAVAACDILTLRGGLTMSLFGPSPRYCTRELVYRELIPARTEMQSLSGLEFVDLIGRLEDAATG